MTLRKRLRGARGAELIELALILPLLLLLIGGIVDFAFMFQAFQVVTNAAREGARVRVLPGYDEPDAESRVSDYISAAGLPGTAITTFSSVPITGGNAVQVQVAYPHTFTMLGPLITLAGGGTTFPNSITLTARSMMRFES